MNTLGRQQGAALVTVLIFLVVLFFLGTSSMQGAQMEERMAGNSWEQSRSFQAAEAGLKDAIEWVFAQNSLAGSADGSTGVYSVGVVGEKIANQEFDWSTARVYGTGTSGSATDDFADSGQSAPRYVVESLGQGADGDLAIGSSIGGGQSLGYEDNAKQVSDGGKTLYYSIWVIGYGKNDTSRTILNAVVGRSGD